MHITMQNLERWSLAEMKEFVEGSRKVCFSTEAREETYGCIEGTLNRQQYRKLSKGQKGIVRRFLAAAAVGNGHSRQAEADGEAGADVDPGLAGVGASPDAAAILLANQVVHEI